MGKWSSCCAKFRATRSPARRNGVSAATRTIPPPPVGAGRTCLRFTARLMRRLPMAKLIPSGSAPLSRWRRLRGFTFVELMVVITIVVILITMAIPIYNNTIKRSKETVLKQNLFTLRTVIDNYTFDKQKAPQSLQDLVSEGYLREVPYDPMTGSNQWRTIQEDAMQ